LDQTEEGNATVVTLALFAAKVQLKKEREREEERKRKL
jgi:hypothetical protein